MACWLAGSSGALAGTTDFSVLLHPATATVTEEGKPLPLAGGTLHLSDDREHTLVFAAPPLKPTTLRIRWDGQARRWQALSCDPRVSLKQAQWGNLSSSPVDPVPLDSPQEVSLSRTVAVAAGTDVYMLVKPGEVKTLRDFDHVPIDSSRKDATGQDIDLIRLSSSAQAVIPDAWQEQTLYVQRPLFKLSPVKLTAEDLKGSDQALEAKLSAALQPLYGPLSYPWGQAGAVALVAVLGGAAVVRRRRQAQQRAAELAKVAHAEMVVQRSSDVLTDADAPPPLLGKQLEGSHGRYTVLKMLGQGGMGAVFEAAPEGRGAEHCAVKMLFPKMLEAGDYQARFERETRICSQLSHPGIVKVLDWGSYTPAEGPAWPFMVMELVRGRDLRAVLAEAQGKTLPLGDVLTWMAESMRALKAAHGAGIIHRDLKPENIMLTAAGHIKLMDFGVARQANATVLTKTNMTMGTPAYMSPEHMDMKQVVPASDVFSMGIMFYELLCGHRPFEADDPYMVVAKMLTEDPTPLRQWRSDLPEDLYRVVDRMIDRDLAVRYAGADQVLEDLARCGAPT